MDNAAEIRDHWRDAIRRRVYVNALLTGSFLLINLLATIVASYGLLANSTAVVIGAMLIATLLGPISGIALALVEGNQELLRKALFAECVGAAMVVTIATVIGKIHVDIPLSAEILARTHPNLLDLMIALAGGAAGGVAIVNKRLSQGLVGTAIATALVPPLASCGISLAHGETRLAWGAFLLFFANFVAIQFASSVVLLIAGFHDITQIRRNRNAYLVRNAVSLVTLVVLAAIFVGNFRETILKQAYRTSVQQSLTHSLRRYSGVTLDDIAIDDSRHPTVILAVVRTPYSFDPERVAAIEAELPRSDGGSPELHIQSVIVKETTRNGYLHETHEPQAAEDGLENPRVVPSSEIDSNPTDN